MFQNSTISHKHLLLSRILEHLYMCFDAFLLECIRANSINRVSGHSNQNVPACCSLSCSQHTHISKRWGCFNKCSNELKLKCPPPPFWNAECWIYKTLRAFLLEWFLRAAVIKMCTPPCRSMCKNAPNE